MIKLYIFGFYICPVFLSSNMKPTYWTFHTNEMKINTNHWGIGKSHLIYLDK